MFDTQNLEGEKNVKQPEMQGIFFRQTSVVSVSMPDLQEWATLTYTHTHTTQFPENWVLPHFLKSHFPQLLCACREYESGPGNHNPVLKKNNVQCTNVHGKVT